MRNAFVLLFLLVGCADDAASTPASAMPEQGEGTTTSSSPQTSAPAAAAVAPDAPCPTSFTKDVMPLLVTTCGSASCHQSDTRPAIEASTPQIAYEDLLDFGFDDESWVDPHPAKSNATNADLVTVVAGWRACGAPFE